MGDPPPPEKNCTVKAQSCDTSHACLILSRKHSKRAWRSACTCTGIFLGGPRLRGSDKWSFKPCAPIPPSSPTMCLNSLTCRFTVVGLIRRSKDVMSLIGCVFPSVFHCVPRRTKRPDSIRMAKFAATKATATLKGAVAKYPLPRGRSGLSGAFGATTGTTQYRKSTTGRRDAIMGNEEQPLTTALAWSQIVVVDLL